MMMVFKIALTLKGVLLMFTPQNKKAVIRIDDCLFRVCEGFKWFFNTYPYRHREALQVFCPPQVAL